jgi:integrase
MPLSDIAIKKAKPKDKAYRLYDERGLYLEVSPAGGKLWRFKYRLPKEKRLSIGIYPDVSLRDARERRDEARRLIAAGVDPGEHRKAAKLAAAGRAADSFEVVTREWYGKHAPGWVEAHSSRILRLFERDIFPHIGGRAIADITAPEVLAVARRIEGHALETAHRAIQNCGQVFRYAVATGRALRDPTGDLRGALPPKRDKKHFAATIEPKRLGEILLALDGYEGTPEVQAALKLAPRLFVRPGELRHMEWAAIDWKVEKWEFFVTKTKVQHIVPLARQSLEILRELHKFTGTGRYAMPSALTASRPMSDNAVLTAMRRLAITKEEMSGHGFRAVARTILDEVLGVRVDYIEHQLAHAVKDPNGRAYNRTMHLEERRKMMQLWADHLDTLKVKAGSRSPH